MIGIVINKSFINLMIGCIYIFTSNKIQSLKIIVLQSASMFIESQLKFIYKGIKIILKIRTKTVFCLLGHKSVSMRLRLWNAFGAFNGGGYFVLPGV